MEIGKINTLKVARIVAPGAILIDDEENEVLLPGKFITSDITTDAEIEVFLYTDSEDRIVATTQRPNVFIGEIAFLKVVDVTSFGAFVDWGLDKDLFVSHKNQAIKMEKGMGYFITPYFDTYSNRMCGTSKLEFLINNDALTVSQDEIVEVDVFSESKLGYNVIVNKKHWGLIYHNEIFQPIHIGETLSAYVKTVRDDNKLDISLYNKGRVQVDAVSQNILNILKIIIIFWH
jgi:uncharacterized protein